MATLVDVLKTFTAINEKDRQGFLIAKFDSFVGYASAYPKLADVTAAIASKIVVADGVLDINEIAFFDIIKTAITGTGLNIDVFIASMVAFAETGADVTAEVAAFQMLPEYIQVDMMYIFIALASIDGEVSDEEVAFLQTLL